MSCSHSNFVLIYFEWFYMKKVNNNNNKFRNNAIYSLNYKFDSVSSAGKVSGTALDLIKKYNELAKEAHSNGDYVAMEVFRQYAEHYRKIVTEINERKTQNRENQNTSAENQKDAVSNNNENNETPLNDNGLVETEAASQDVKENKEDTDNNTENNIKKKKSFTVIEVSSSSENIEKTEEKPCKRRVVRKKAPKVEEIESSEN